MKILKAFLLLVMCLSCSGCFQAESNLKITEGGAVTMKNKFLGVPYIAGIIEETKNNLTAGIPEAKVRPLSEGNYNGYEIEIFYPDLEKFAANNLEMFQARPGKCKGVQISSGWFYNSCSFDLLFEGSTIDAQSREAAIIAESIISQFKLDFTVELPYAAESSNADFMSNDGKIFTWNIAPSLINGKDKSMQLNFKIYNTTRIAATFFIVLILIAGVIYNLSQAKKKQTLKGESENEQENFQNK